MDGGKKRLDVLVVERGLAASRAKAADLIRAGRISSDGRVIDKPGATLAAEAAIELVGDAPQYVARSALKLAHALDHFRLDVTGEIVLDVGASTGGFTEVLLERGAAKVYAADVGRDQLHPSLRADPRVVSLEATDARALDRVLVPDPIDFIVCDVSFISLLKVLAAPLALSAPGCRLVTLVKPQFEVGPQFVGKGGIVKDADAVAAALERVRTHIDALPGWRVLGLAASPITGRDGNQEYLLAAVRA
jgi:23S rRNA (cytidine1920-2'-O)/16S rRNA (cytidine1409-2'-O)-methyltransferase